MKTLALALAPALALLPGTALAVDLLPTEVSFDDTEARILVRSQEGSVRVETTPVVMAAASAPGTDAGEFAPTPRVLAADRTWHGLDGVVVVVLKRAEAKQAVDVVIEDGSQTGVWLDWPAAHRRVPAPGPVTILLVIAAAKGFASAGRPRR